MKKNAVNQQQRDFMAHRQFLRTYFKANDMDFAFQLILGTVVHGGASIGESFYVASRIKDGDPLSWEREWSAMAERVKTRAEASLTAGHLVSGREACLRAAMYHRAVLASMAPDHPNFKTNISKMRECFRKGSSLLELPVEQIEIPFEGGSLPGYFQKVSPDARPRRTLIMIGGGETFSEDLYFFIAPAALKRGYNFLTVDLPGQGDLPFKGSYFRADYETPMRVVVDYALSRKDVDGARLAAYGISAGGYMVPRAAAYEPRIKACIANSMIFDMYQIFIKSPIPRLKGLARCFVNWRAPFQMRMLELIAWRWGVTFDDPADVIAKNLKVKFDPALIQCPTLILIGEGEYQNSEIRRQQQAALAALPNPQKQLIVAPADEGAAHHVIGENPGLMSALVFDWLDEIFK